MLSPALTKAKHYALCLLNSVVVVEVVSIVVITFNDRGPMITKICFDYQ